MRQGGNEMGWQGQEEQEEVLEQRGGVGGGWKVIK